MIHSQRSKEGYFLSDQRVSGGTLEEHATVSCSHCQRTWKKNPHRVRPRPHCGKCDSYICDWCESIRVKTGECRPFRQVIEEAQERAFVALNLSQV